jgi:quercetin dioxygenase-like cupin family protein
VRPDAAAGSVASNRTAPLYHRAGRLGTTPIAGAAAPARVAFADGIRRWRMNMTIEGFVASHARDATFERGLRSFFEYRDLGIRRATGGRVVAHVIRAAAGDEFSSQPHLHRTSFQMVYVLKGWIEFEYEGQGVVRLEAGSCVHQPPEIRHREVGHSADIEMLEIVMPADFATQTVDRVPG